MSVTIYHNPRCSKSRQTLAILEENNAGANVVEYLTEPPFKTELTKILAMLGPKASDVVRKKEAAAEGVDVSALSEAALIDQMVAHPIIIERPIVVAGDKAVIGRPPENVLTII
jgi:arsenate reductase